MNMTYAEIMNRHDLLLKIGHLTLPRKVSAAIARNLVKLEKEFELYNKQRLDIANRYAKKDEEGEFILTAVGDKSAYTFNDTKDEVAFRTEAKDLDETEIDVDIMKFDAAEMERCEMVERYDFITPVQEAALGWMINYGE